MAKGRVTLVDGPRGKVHGITHDAPGRGPWKSRWYIWKVYVDGMGWEGDGKEMGTREGAVLSHPVAAHT